MKKNIIFILVSFILFTGCQRNEVIKTHGISYLEKREKLITINKSNKNDTILLLGQPATKGMTDDNLWIYIERTKARGKLFMLGKTYIKKNNVLLLEFDKYGILYKKEFYDKDAMKNINFAKKITENDLRKENFIYSFLSSIRQKMQTKKR